jgi:large subunit ribosomal protein L13Ae
MFEKVVVVDCSGHLLGRVASTLAKELLQGQKVVCVRTEELNISGSLFRNKLIFGKFLQHRGSTKPARGPFHFRSPARILWRTIRGMINHKTKRGQAALERLKVFEGVPHPYDRVKRVVIPNALRVLRLKPGRKFCRLGDLSAQVGWSHNDLVKRLETKRKVKAFAWYQTKKQLQKLRKQAVANVLSKHGPQPSVGGAPAVAASSSSAAAPQEKKQEKQQPKKDNVSAKKETAPKTDAPAAKPAAAAAAPAKDDKPKQEKPAKQEKPKQEQKPKADAAPKADKQSSKKDSKKADK